MTRKEAIEIIKSAMPHMRKESKEAIQTLIPELAENEDEKIRKEIIDFLTDGIWNTTIIDKVKQSQRYAKWIAYLENQEEQKPLQYDIDVLEKHITKDSVSELAHTVIIRNGWEIVEKEQETVACENDFVSKEWSEEDETHRDFILELLEDQIRFCKKDAEGAYHVKQIRTAQNWFKSLRPQPHTVSIKDATKFGNIEYERGVKDGIQSEKSRQWKPSKEQIRAILSVLPAVKGCGNETQSILESLYNDLKKLL